MIPESQKAANTIENTIPFSYPVSLSYSNGGQLGLSSDGTVLAAGNQLTSSVNIYSLPAATLAHSLAVPGQWVLADSGTAFAQPFDRQFGSECFVRSGGPCRDRTYDQEIKSLLLYQLS